MTDAIQWLLEDGNPAVQYRTKTEILGEEADSADARTWILSKLPANWHETKGLWYRYYVTALAECGLRYSDVPEGCLDRALAELEGGFECSCADFMLLSALVRLGLGECAAIRNILSSLPAHQLPDGGFVCTRQRNKLDHTPKGCYKSCMHALLLASACRKQHVDAPFEKALADYFLRRNLFYRTDAPGSLVLDSRAGWRSIDVFHPFEVMRVGLHTIVEGFATLGYGDAPPVLEAFDLLSCQKDAAGRVILSGTLTKSYLPKERAGKPSHWATFYALLAEKERRS